MSKKMDIFFKEFCKVMNENQKFCFMSRGKEFQQEAVNKLITFKGKATSLKKEMVELKNENFANILLSLEELIDCIINELKMWIAFKEDEPNKAWEFLINAQGAIRTAAEASNVEDLINVNIKNYTAKLNAIEKLLFPPQIFFSSGFIIENEKCSICDKEYGECDHIAGKAYMGKMCNTIVTKAKLKEVSVVKEPGFKQARVYSFNFDGKAMRDLMTYREETKKEK